MYNKELQAKLTRYLVDGKIKQDHLAKMLGYSNGGVLSSYKNSKYPGDVEKMERSLEEYFRNIEAKEEHTAQAVNYNPSKKYVPTSVSEKVRSAIRYCHLEKGIVAVIGESGVGKSMGAFQYVKENPSSSIYLEVLPSNSSLRSFLRSLCRVMNLPDTGSISDMSETIRSRLLGMEKVLILDEAQNLPFKTIEEIRNWSECNQLTGVEGVGLVLVGNEDVEEVMRGKKYDRTRNRRDLIVRCRTEDATQEDADKLFPMFSAPEQQKERKLICAICRSWCGVRGARKIYASAAKQQADKGLPVDFKSLLSHAREYDAMLATLSRA